MLSDDLAVAVADGLRGQHHRLEAGPADRVDGQRRHALRQAALDHALARRVLTGASREHLAKDDFVDLLAAQPGSLEQLLDHRSPQLGRRGLGERAAELADRSAGSGDDDDVFHDESLLA
jgi:hypothetical protein